MKISQAFKLAWESIIGNRMRSFLTMLGMIIGVASVITLISIMQAMADYVSQQFSDMGTNQLQVSIQNTDTRNVEIEEIYQLVADNPTVFQSVTPSMPVSLPVRKGTIPYKTTSVKGVGEDFADINTSKISKGRFLYYADIYTKQNSCVIGSYLNDEMFGSNEALGQTLKIGAETYKVVGVLESKGESVRGGANDSIYISYSNACNLIKNKNVPSYVFNSFNEDTVPQAQQILDEFLFQKLKSKDSFYIFAMSEILTAMNQTTSMMTAVLVGIAGISLLVAGIGIMNIMLVSVTERTKEIGIRKSLGAKRKNIMWQFVIEAGTTSSIGGLIGIILGGSFTTLIGKLVKLNATPSFGAIALSFGISVGIGIIFGYMPASKAAKLNPIDALRNE